MKKYIVKILVESETPKEARETIESLGLKAYQVSKFDSIRTLNQNSALWLFFTQLAEELNEHGIDMRQLIRKEIEIPWTKESIHEYLWKPLQYAMFHTNSTTKLKKTEEIDKIYDVLNRTICERSNGEINMPPFPSLDILIDKQE